MVTVWMKWVLIKEPLAEYVSIRFIYYHILINGKNCYGLIMML